MRFRKWGGLPLGNDGREETAGPRCGRRPRHLFFVREDVVVGVRADPIPSSGSVKPARWLSMALSRASSNSSLLKNSASGVRNDCVASMLALSSS